VGSEPIEPSIVATDGYWPAKAIANLDSGFIPTPRIQPVLNIFASQRIHCRLQRLVVKELQVRRVLKRVVRGKLFKAPFHIRVLKS